MSQKATYTESVKVNLSSDVYQKIVEEAENAGLSKSAVARSKIRKQVNA